MKILIIDQLPIINSLKKLILNMATGKGKIQTALELAGSHHKYQKILILLIALTWIEVNYLLLGPTLIYMDPIFTCQSTGD